ncbi:MAG: lactate racemase domain-containing protein [Dehalococcoidia bacterium]|nr:lactate racemase domain-containing protein [Dehalococcoidia bacterium]
MPEVTLPYGDSTVRAELPERAVLVGGGDGGPHLQPVAGQETAVRDALAKPLGLPRIGQLVRPGNRVLIAFDDPTAPSFGPVRRLAIEGVLEELRAAGVPEENVNLVCANALHRKWTREELARILGPELVQGFGERLQCHDAEDADNIVSLGKTASGYDVDVHRLVAESDLTVYVNAACHLGFNGGWKSVAVGLSTWRSIRWTHTPDGMSMSVRSNRMHAVFEEQGRHIEQALGRRIFKFETVLATPAAIGRCWAGGVDECRAAALDLLASMHPPRRSQAREPADIVVYGVPNWSPYATFAQMNPILTLISSALGYLGGYIEALGKPGCSVIIATPCPEQWDMEHHPSYKEVWERVLPATKDPYEITERFGEEFAGRRDYIDQYRFGVAFHPIHGILATHPLKRLKHAARVYVAGPDDPAVPRHAGFIPANSVEDALADALQRHGPDASIAVVRNPQGV